MITCEWKPPGTVTLKITGGWKTYHAKRDGQGRGKLNENCPAVKNKHGMTSKARLLIHVRVSPCMQPLATPHTDPWRKTAGQHYFVFNLALLHLATFKRFIISHSSTWQPPQNYHSTQQQSTPPNIVPWVGWIHFLLRVLPGASILALSTEAHFLKPI